jgi:Ca2+-binding RTX toxin-like protein
VILVAVGACASFAPASIAGAAAGDIYVVDSANDTLYRIDASSGVRSTVASGSPISDPRGMVFGPDGQLYIAESSGAGSILRVNPTTGAKTTVASGVPLVNPRGLAFTATGRLLVGDNGTIDGCMGGPVDALVVDVNPATGSKATLASGGFMNETNGVTVFPDGSIFVSDCGAAGEGGPADGRVIRIDPVTGDQTPIATGGMLLNPNGIAAGPGGVAYVSDFGPTDTGGTPLDGKIVRVTSSGAQSLLTEGVNIDNPQGPVFDFAGNLVLADLGLSGTTVTTDGEVIRVTASGVQSLVEEDLRNPRGVAIEPPRCAGRIATIIGTTGPDVITGSAANDVIAGLGAGDRINGLGGKDIICGAGGKDRLKGKGGTDLLLGQGGADRLAGGKGRDKLKGAKGRDRLRGQAGRDVLLGGAGGDRLIGGPGRDRLRGGPGRDVQIQ